MIDAIVRGALNQRFLVTVLTVIIVVTGVLQLKHLPVDAFPDVTNVQVQVAAEAPGRSPEEVERFITVPLEIAMTGLPGLVEMRSVNRNSLSQLILVFTEQTDVYFARQLVLERLIEATSQMPKGVTPVLGPVSSGLGEIYQYTLEQSEDDGPLSIETLTERRTIQDWIVRPLLRGIAGVAEINAIGGFEKQYQVEPNPDKLRHYNLTLKDVYSALALNNANSGGGKLPHYSEQYLIRGVGLIQSVEDIESIVLKESDGIPVHIHDVARVFIGTAVRSGAVIKNGQTESVGGIVMMLLGGNAKQIVSEVKQRVDEINGKGLLPHHLKIVPFYDRSELVDAAIHTVVKVLIEAMILVAIVLTLFLGDVRSSLIVLVTLIVTPLCTFMAMSQLGLSANLMSLGGLAIAIGIMVDGSVVVVENAYCHLGESRVVDNNSKGRILLKATREVGAPVIFGVGIICLVFMPLMKLEGIEGKLFAPLAYTIVIALTISLVLSLTLSPVLCSYWLKGGAHGDTAIIARLKGYYQPMLDWALKAPSKIIGLSVVLFVLCLSLIPFLGTSFIPELMEGSIVPGINRAPSLSLDDSIQLESEATRLIKKLPGVKTVVSQLGRSANPNDSQAESESTPIASLDLGSAQSGGLSQQKIMQHMREVLSVIPGIQVVMSQPIADRVDEMMTGVPSDVAIKIFGDELKTLKETADSVLQVLDGVEGVADVRVERLSGQQFLTININRRAIARHGINVSDVNDIIDTAIGGRVSTDVYEGERRFSVSVRFPESFRNNVSAIENILMKSPNGAMVRLSDLADIQLIDGPAQISREMGKRRIIIGANVENRDLGGFVDEVQKGIAAKVKLPPGYFIKWGGQFENLERAAKRLGIIIPITLGAIFFMLFLLFNSLGFATLIILILPFASVGGVLSLFLTHEYLSVPASVGFITLWGIAVLNGVVLVTYIRGLRRTGVELEDAIRKGCMQRFRPVMMTATVAMLGLIPFLFSDGPGSEVQRPLAIVVIGGLITSTLLTLLVLPALYPWFDQPFEE